MLNNRGEAAFVVSITGGPSPSGVFLHSNDHTTKIMAAGEPTPVGGVFESQTGLLGPLGRKKVKSSIKFLMQQLSRCQ